ncbi:MAG: dUTPase [Gammaproteobacteria bacterium]|nr:dUTPase [Gammaproteobacteria bacterium]NIN62555.1 dUTPase [Gammaproteobacteria bacterium]NIO63118.1 dUTPase [Gammaproteobacteria bacterium]NIP48495.1 dUTPase [Gammaproteobacteria bacterium]NIQ08529.1 dUTPase [Gammaproteobacteria bacterium]
MSEIKTGDMLSQIFEMQTELNNYVFSSNKLGNNSGNTLSMTDIFEAVNNNQLMVNDLPNRWLVNYSKAMREELNELDDDLLWKWWSKDRIDIQNIRVELIDILHFLVSAMICAGLTADKVFDVYQQKHSINLDRQDLEYSKDSKNEDDNRTIR